MKKLKQIWAELKLKIALAWIYGFQKGVNLRKK
jgi:hypothetical protein